MAFGCGDFVAFCVVNSAGSTIQDLKDHMRGAGGQVEYVKIMQDFDGRPKVLTPSPFPSIASPHCATQIGHATLRHIGVWSV